MAKLTIDDICRMAWRAKFDKPASDPMWQLNPPMKIRFPHVIVLDGNQNPGFEASFPHFCTQEIVLESK